MSDIESEIMTLKLFPLHQKQMDTYYNLEIFLHRDIFNEYVAKIGKIFQKLKKIKQKNENKDIFFTIFE